MGTNDKRRPASFRGVEGDASASCELRKRAKTSSLSDDEVKLLKKNKIAFEVDEYVTETFAVNAAYKNDQVLLEKVSEALGEIDGMPEDFIQFQEGKTRSIVTDQSIEQIFTKKPSVTRELLDVVAVMAIKPKLETGDVSDAMTRLTELLADEE